MKIAGILSDNLFSCTAPTLIPSWHGQSMASGLWSRSE